MKFTFFIFFLSSFLSLKAQDDHLPIDERGKFIYYEIVDLKNFSKDSLKIKALNFLKKKIGVLTHISAHGDTAFSANGKFTIDKTLLVMSHPSGEIPFHFEIEIKDGKYRYWLTDFTFIPYQRDRYGNFVPSTSIGIPLENNPGKLNAAQWKAYQTQAASHAKALGSKLKEFMASREVVVAPTQERTVINKNW